MSKCYPDVTHIYLCDIIGRNKWQQQIYSVFLLTGLAVIAEGGRGWGLGEQNPNLRISFSVSFLRAKPPSQMSSELLIPPGRLPEGLWSGSSSKSGSNSCGFLLIHWETPAGYLIVYISSPSQSSGTSSPLCISSGLTLADKTLIMTQVQTICARNIYIRYGHLEMPKMLEMLAVCSCCRIIKELSWQYWEGRGRLCYWWNFHSGSVKLYPSLYE